MATSKTGYNPVVIVVFRLRWPIYEETQRWVRKPNQLFFLKQRIAIQLGRGNLETENARPFNDQLFCEDVPAAKLGTTLQLSYSCGCDGPFDEETRPAIGRRRRCHTTTPRVRVQSPFK